MAEYDLETMNVGLVVAGRIGLRVLQPSTPLGVKLHFLDRQHLPEVFRQQRNLP